MTGKLSVQPAGIEPEKHDHLVLFQNDRALVFSDPRMFGLVTFDAGEDPPAWWTDLPPDVLSPDFSKTFLEEKLRNRGRSLIKPLLLDQSIFLGIGNWMADEILWRIRVNPSVPVGDLGERGKELWAATRKVARQAMQVIAPDWSRPPDSWLFNHRWADGGVCPRCKEALLRESLRGRTTCWCPSCQPG